MKRFADAGRKAVADQNWYAALSLALTIPDICGSLEDPGPGKSEKRYVRWCRQWLEPKVTGGPPGYEKVFLSAEDCYQLRNSLIHSGSVEIAQKRRVVLDRMEFFESGSHLNWVEGMVVNGEKQPNFLQMRADLFSETMFVAAEEWDASVADNSQIQSEKARLLVIHPLGTTIGGVKFG